MRTPPSFIRALVSGCLSASLSIAAAHAAIGPYYNPSNPASPTGKTSGYTLYRTIGCPARELLGTPCFAPRPTDSPASAGQPADAQTALPCPAAVRVEPLRMVAPVEPMRVVVPAPPRTAQYCAILDIQFEIDQDEIQREYREKLAVLGTFMKKYPDTTAVIEGHTDWVGSDADNQALSQRRAESVVNYLINYLDIGQDRLTAIGHGESRPVADNATEEGKRLNRRIDAVIACVTDIEGLAVKPARVTMALQMEFDRNQAEIKPEYVDDLAKVARFLIANPGVTATVEGHTGNLQGSEETILEISRQRAINVVNYLIDHYAIAPSRLTAEGFGKDRRFAYNTSLEGQQENRRVNIIFNYPK